MQPKNDTHKYRERQSLAAMRKANVEPVAYDEAALTGPLQRYS